MNGLFLVDYRAVLPIWPVLEPELRKLAKHSANELTPADIFRQLEAEKMQLWTVVKDDVVTSYMLTQVLDYSTHRCCNVVFLVGKDLPETLKGFDTLKSWCRRLGISRITCYARKGLMRKLAPAGFKLRYFVLDAEVG
jgi:hypothetical protein